MQPPETVPEPEGSRTPTGTVVLGPWPGSTTTPPNPRPRPGHRRERLRDVYACPSCGRVLGAHHRPTCAVAPGYGVSMIDCEPAS